MTSKAKMCKVSNQSSVTWAIFFAKYTLFKLLVRSLSPYSHKMEEWNSKPIWHTKMSNLERAKSQGSNKQQTLSNQTPILFQRLIKLYAINLKMVVIIPYTDLVDCQSCVTALFRQSVLCCNNNLFWWNVFGDIYVK